MAMRCLGTATERRLRFKMDQATCIMHQVLPNVRRDVKQAPILHIVQPDSSHLEKSTSRSRKDPSMVQKLTSSQRLVAATPHI